MDESIVLEYANFFLKLAYDDFELMTALECIENGISLSQTMKIIRDRRVNLRS